MQSKDKIKQTTSQYNFDENLHEAEELVNVHDTSTLTATALDADNRITGNLQKRCCIHPVSASFYTVRIDPQLIRTAIKDGFLTELSFFYFLKLHYKYSRTGTEKNVKRRLSDLSGLSLPTINKYIRALHYRDLLRYENNGFVLAPTAKTKIRHKIKVRRNTTVNDIKRRLQLQVMRDAGRRQEFIRSLTDFVKDERSFQKLSEYVELNCSFRPHLSVRYVSKLCNISNMTTLKLIRDLNYQRLIRTETSDADFVCECNNGDDKFLEGSFGHKYVKNGCLYVVHPSRHDFIERPIQKRPMTLQRYKTVTKNSKVRRIVDEINASLMN
jgi:hypothetical protein